jgi:dTDP-glucose pyrophosphorylase
VGKGIGCGKLDITYVNNQYIWQSERGYSVLDGYWIDAGTFGN